MTTPVQPTAPANRTVKVVRQAAKEWHEPTLKQGWLNPRQESELFEEIRRRVG